MKKKILKGIQTAIFLGLLSFTVIHTSYLFRNDDINRANVMGIKEEPTDIDVAYIGGSAAFVYWQPPLAWDKYGITSYVLGTNAVRADNLTAYIEQILKYKDPELFIIDARPFEYDGIRKKDEERGGFRNGCDSLPYGTIRTRLITNHILHADALHDSPLDLYFDICFYHNNKNILKQPENWKHIRNNTEARYTHGFNFYPEYAPIEPVEFATADAAALQPGAEKALLHLLDVCDEKGINALFVVSPYQETKEHKEKFNTVEKIVKERGYSFLDANEHIKEIGMDYQSDFYNINHANPLGAAKYTSYLANYLVEQYNLPDHRNDPEYEIWNEDSKGFQEKQEKAKQIILDLKKNYSEEEKCEN